MALKDGLLHWWELGDRSWLDSHGSWNLTNRTAVSINSTGAPDGGPAAVFNGSHYLDRTNVAWDGSGAARSIQIWARYSALSFTGNWLISHRGSSAETVLHQAYFSNPDSPLFDSLNALCNFSDGTITRVMIGDANPPADTWLHILATTNGTNRHRLYVNADMQHELTDALSGVISTAQPFSIGTYSWDKLVITGRHRGLACLAAVWQREVSESEAVQLYNGGAGRRYAALDMVSSGAKIARLRRAHAEIRGMRA